MHILPELKRLEKSFPPSEGLVIVGVHSAKFENEKVIENIREAVLRYDIEHPVVNDAEAYVWNALQVQCWPTLVIMGPDGHGLFVLEGEGSKEHLFLICETVLEYFKRTHNLSTSILPMKLLKNSLSPSVLYYPGKVCVAPCEKIVVSDTGHHRIVIVGKNGIIEDVIGCGKQGFQDGSCNNAQFNLPQGVVWENPCFIYVADTGNHAVRLINLEKRTVETVAGNGIQGSDQEGGLCGTFQPLNSPWDLCLGPGIDSDDASQNEVLYIAMAGSHQIWALCLKDCRWLKGSGIKKGCCINFAGSGMEENRNNSYPHRAGFAQPSGIALSKGEPACLLVADSESSSIRSISLVDGCVKGLAGGSLNPQNLFAFGDEDGIGLDAKLQHPLGICSSSPKSAYIADSYNHKIKILNLLTKECKTFCGSGTCGNRTGFVLSSAEFSEPGGLCITDDGKIVIVADTNNHCIKLIDIEQESVSQLPVFMPTQDKYESVDITDCSLEQRNASEVQEMPVVKLVYGGTATFVFKIHAEEDFTLTEGAPHQWTTHIKNGKNLCILGENHGFLSDLSSQPVITVYHKGNHICTALIIITVKMYLCRKSSKTCFPRKIIYHIPLEVGNAGSSKSNMVLSCTLN